MVIRTRGHAIQVSMIIPGNVEKQVEVLLEDEDVVELHSLSVQVRSLQLKQVAVIPAHSQHDNKTPGKCGWRCL